MGVYTKTGFGDCDEGFEDCDFDDLTPAAQAAALRITEDREYRAIAAAHFGCSPADIADDSDVVLAEIPTCDAWGLARGWGAGDDNEVA